MACRKAFDLDLVACLLDADRPEWTDFRDHYPRCADCSAEVRTWTELQASLAPPHPSADDLYQFEVDGPGMRLEVRQTILAHVTKCRSCRDELRALRTFDSAALPASATVSPAPPVPEPRRRRWPSLRGLLLHPAFAYGIALAVAYPTIAPRLRPIVVEQVKALEGRWEPPPRPAGVGTTESQRPGAATPPLAAAPPPPTALRDAPAEEPAFGLRADADERPALLARRKEEAEADLSAAAPMVKSADAPEERTAGANDDWPVVVLTANREVAVYRPVEGLMLRLAPPRSLPAMPAGLAWMRVRDAAGRRELREQQMGNPGSNAEMRIPTSWLEPGSYRAELVLGDDTRPVVTARFRIEP